MVVSALPDLPVHLGALARPKMLDELRAVLVDRPPKLAGGNRDFCYRCVARVAEGLS